MTKESAQPKALNILRPSQPLPSSKPNSILSSYSSSSSATSNSQQHNLRKPRVTSVAQLHVTSSEKPTLNIYHPPTQQQQQQQQQRNVTTSNSNRQFHHYRLSENESDSSSTASSTISSSRRKHLSSSSYHHQTTKERPAIEIYKPGASTKQQQQQQQQQRAINGTGSFPSPKSSSMTKSFTAPVITSNNKYNHQGPTLSSSSYRSPSASVSPAITADINSSASSTPSSPPPPQLQPTSPSAKYSVLSPHQQYQSASPTNIPTSPNHQFHYPHQHQQQYTSITNHQQYQQQHFLQGLATTTSSSSSSSVSASTASYDDDRGREERQQDSDQSDDGDDKENQEDQDSTVLNEARVNRQIADLEISNQSLLAVNAMLEATVRKQASEMAQMKKQMTFSDDRVPVNPLVLPLPSSELSEDEWENDTTFQRLCRMTDKMIEQGQHAITFKFKGLGRVISYTEQIDDDEDDVDNDDLQRRNNSDDDNAMDK